MRALGKIYLVINPSSTDNQVKIMLVLLISFLNNHKCISIFVQKYLPNVLKFQG